MRYENIGKVVDKWLEDENFRQNLRKDLDGTIRQCNITLSKEEVELLKAIDWKLSDTELKARINKGM